MNIYVWTGRLINQCKMDVIERVIGTFIPRQTASVDIRVQSCEKTLTELKI